MALARGRRSVRLSLRAILPRRVQAGRLGEAVARLVAVRVEGRDSGGERRPRALRQRIVLGTSRPQARTCPRLRLARNARYYRGSVYGIFSGCRLPASPPPGTHRCRDSLHQVPPWQRLRRRGAKSSRRVGTEKGVKGELVESQVEAGREFSSSLCARKACTARWVCANRDCMTTILARPKLGGCSSNPRARPPRLVGPRVGVHTRASALVKRAAAGRESLIDGVARRSARERA
jgi:antitoxin (DNA-binding transcriptional repressor) of toxin-antitoxin stability system